MRKSLATIFVLLGAALAPAQTTTFNGVIKDLSNTPIPTGQVTFALKPSVDTTISGQGRFVPSTTFCEIHNPAITSTSGTGTITVNVGTAQTWQVGDSLIFVGTADATLNGSSVATPYTITLVNSTTSFNFTQSGTHTNGAVGTVGGLYKSGGTGPCSVMQSSAITPANTYYSVSLWPIFSLTSSFNTYAAGSGPVDISTVVPTPGQQPAYSFVDLFTNQTITGIKTFSNGIIFNGGISSAGPNNLAGGGTLGGTFNCTIVNAVRCISPSNPQGWAGSDPGAWINSAAACSGGCKIQIASGTYAVSTAIVLPHGITLWGAGKGNVAADTPTTMLQEANGANLAAMITATGTGVEIHDMFIDGNLANNPSALDGVITSQVKFSIINSRVNGFKRHDWVLQAASEDTQCVNSEFPNAGQNGVEIQSGATDIFLTMCGGVNNGNNNLHASGTVGGLHILGGDWSGIAGAADCIFLDGTAGVINASQIVGANILPCPQNGIRAINSNSLVISGNYISNVGTAANNTYDGIQINNFGDATIVGNAIADGSTNCAGHPCMRYGVNIVAESQKNELGPNDIRGAQTAAYNPGANDDVLGGPSGTFNIINNSLRVGVYGASNAALLDLNQKAATSTTVLSTGVNGDSNSRLSIQANGLMAWGSGSAPGDVTLARLGTGSLGANGSLRATQQIADQGIACTNGELALSAGWQSTGSATVTAVVGNGQTCSWTITTGTTTAANPTVTDTLTNTLPAATTLCELNIHGGTHAPAAGEGFQQTTLSATAPIFTFNGTPTAGGTTYFITRRCGP